MSPTSCRCSTPRLPMVATVGGPVKLVYSSPRVLVQFVRCTASSPEATCLAGARQDGSPITTGQNDGVASAHRSAHCAPHVQTSPQRPGPRDRSGRPCLPRSAGRVDGDDPDRFASNRPGRSARPPRCTCVRRTARPDRPPSRRCLKPASPALPGNVPTDRRFARSTFPLGAGRRSGRPTLDPDRRPTPETATADEEAERRERGHDDREEIERQPDVDLREGPGEQ